MKLKLERIFNDGDATIGILRLDDIFQCFTLEDEYRLKKVSDETRIPAGTYTVGLRDEGGMTVRYGERYPDFHRGMLWLRNVPNFQWIYIHVGNRDTDTSGCILVGDQVVSTPGDMQVLSSRAAYERLYKAVVQAAATGTLKIEVVNRDMP